MSISKLIGSIVTFTILFFSVVNCHAKNTKINLGEKMTAAEIKKWSITVYPDGRGLPEGQGSAAIGEKIYGAKCLSCHGKTGTEGPEKRLSGSMGFQKKYPKTGVTSVGAMWPKATSLFDYIRRAMPRGQVKTLTNEEVYSLTAYVLFLNGIVPKEKVFNASNLHKIEMPGDALTVNLWDQEKQK